MRIVDTRGQQCPAPLIAAKKALNETDRGQSFQVLTDNKVSFSNLCRFLRDNGAKFSTEENQGTWTLTVTGSTEPSDEIRAEEYCSTVENIFPMGDFVIAFSGDRMGEGAEELGRVLMVNLLKAIKGFDLLPGKLLFYNSGVYLACEGSEVLEYIRDLERMGVEILICATCISYYNLEDKRAAGTLSNMFEIAQAMASAGHVIKP